MRTAAFSLLLLAVAHTAPGAAPTTPAAPDAPKDGPVPTKDAAAKMTVPPGFKVTLFAGEPDIVQPIAFTFDDRGRMWVVECLSYPKWSKDGKGSDRVVILEDTDGNGTFDKKTVFLDNGVNLSGIELGFGGAWLCSSPNLLFVPILADDKPGKPEVVLDGWNMTDTKHNIFNSLGWGPDGWLYGCNGIQAKAWVGTPGTPKEKRPYMDCGVWRYHPTRKVFEPVAHGTTNPFGLDWDEHGEMFITNCVIDHLFHVVPGGHYQRMYGQDANPHAYGLMKSCVDYKHWAGGDWTSSRTTGPGGKPEHSDAGGGHAHSGCAIYLGDNFPAEYRNTLFTANIHGNRLNNDGLERTPSGMKGVRRKDFLFANDSWFRGICVKCGPDGALYVSDWCDTGECHNYDKADTTNGRIYRVSYGDPKQWTGDVSKLSDAELVKMTVFAGNEWAVRKARRVLQERAAAGKLEKGTVEALQASLRGDKETTRKLRAAWALSATGGLTDGDVQLMTKDTHPAVRIAGTRLGLDALPSNPAVGEAVSRLGSDEVVSVRRAVAGQAHKLSNPALGALLESLLKQSADEETALMLWYALEPTVNAGSVKQLAANPHPRLAEFAIRKLLAKPESRTEVVRSCLAEIGATAVPGETQTRILRGMRDSLLGVKNPELPAEWTALYPKLAADKSPVVRDLAADVALIFRDPQAVEAIRKQVTDASLSAEARRGAIGRLAAHKIPGVAPTFRTLLDDPAVRTAAIRGLAAFADAETPAAIIKAYPKFTPEEKLDAVQTLAARKEWANALLEAVEKKDVPRADIPVTTARQILALNDKALSTRLETVWGKIGVASKERAALTKKWKELLTEDTLSKANAANGRALFAKHCGACHKMFGEGQAVGPELTGSQRTSLDYVLENVLDPSAVVPREFQMVNFTTVDDRVISGIVLRETKDAITVRTTNDTVVLPAADIAARKQTNVSIMPDGLFDQLKPDEVRDLIAFLRAKEQVPLPK
jgi:putative membrane-bound dehydrogenase-like protein